MMLKQFLTDSTIIGCVLQQLFIIAFNSKILSNFLADLSSGTTIFTTNCNNRTCCIVTHNSHILSASIQQIHKYELRFLFNTAIIHYISQVFQLFSQF